MTHVFVVPPLDGPISGGTLFNRQLVQGLRDLGASVRVAQTIPDEDFAWVDSLYLSAAEPRWPQQRLGLLAHYLPSLVEHPQQLDASALRSEERAALEHAAAIVCPSAWMAETLRRLGAQQVHVVEPGLPSEAQLRSAPPSGAPRLVMVGNVTPGKGLLPLLEALAQRPPAGPWSLDVIGSTDADPDYARRCAAAASNLPVRLVGALPPSACLREVAAAHALVSASVMESYGMAIAEAIACGLPVLALEGGNVRALVGRSPAGTVTASVQALAQVLRTFVDDASVRGRALDLARHPPARPPAPAQVFAAICGG